MRQLDPKIAEERKRKVLHWVVHNYIKTSRPIASSIIANEAGMDLSSATIRNILKELEEEGCLQQPHTSSGRIPTDRGYRFYVDYLHDVRRLAAAEKARIESQYESRLEELDNLLSQTSKILSHITNKTGLVLSPKVETQTLRRLDLIPLGGPQVLVVVVTQAGQVRHWPIRLPFVPPPNRIQMLNNFLNEQVQGMSIRQVREVLASRIDAAGRELRELHSLTDKLLDEVDGMMGPDELYLDGALTLMQGAEELGDLDEIHSMMRLMEERRSLARLLEDEFRSRLKDADETESGLVKVRIGEENPIPELRRLSLVTTAYKMNDKVVGVLGILGSKRMEYSRMMSLVDYVSRLVTRTLESWDEEDAAADERKRRSKR